MQNYKNIWATIFLALSLTSVSYAHEGHETPGSIKANHGGIVKPGKEINLEYVVSLVEGFTIKSVTSTMESVAVLTVYAFVKSSVVKKLGPNVYVGNVGAAPVGFPATILLTTYFSGSK